MERSIYSARYCFVENLYRLNYLSRLEYIILDKWFKHLVLSNEDDQKLERSSLKSSELMDNEKLEYNMLSRPTGIDIDLIIYLRCTPQKVMDRIRFRSRSEEKDISLEYIQSLHDLHEDWLIKRKFPVPAPVLVLDTNCKQGSLANLYERAAPYIWSQTKLNQPVTIMSHDESPSIMCGY